MSKILIVGCVVLNCSHVFQSDDDEGELKYVQMYVVSLCI